MLALLLAAALGVQAAGDQAAAAPKAQMTAWTAPLARAYTALGTDRLGASGRPSLLAMTAESIRSSEGRQAQRLADALAENVTAEEFEAKSSDEKLVLMRAAAVRAEHEASADADAFLATAHDQRLTARSADFLESRVAGFKQDAHYLLHDLNERLDSLSARIADFRAERAAAFEKWREELPRRIDAGGFGAETISFDGHEWRVADHPPTWDGHPSFPAAFEARLQEIGAMSPGPWKAELYVALNDTLKARAGAGDVDAVTAAALDERLRAVGAAELQKSARAGADVERAAAAVRAGRPLKAKEIRALLRHYDRDWSFSGGPIERFYRADVLNRGRREQGFPSFFELDAARLSVMSNHHSHALRGMFSLIGTITAFALNSILKWLPQGEPWYYFVGLVVMIGLFAYYFYHLWQRDELGWDGHYGARAAADEQRRALAAK